MKYFNEIGTFGLNATCSHCAVTTLFAGQSRFRIEENGINLVKYQYQFQCQDCGALQMGGFHEKSFSKRDG